MAQTAIVFHNVTKKFRKNEYYAVDHLDFQVEEGEFVTILGTSGCGKTTLLKMVNRLCEPDTGVIQLFGEDIASLNVVEVRRKIGYVIQQIGLFPHMTIAENIATVLKLLKWSKDDINARVLELFHLIGLSSEEYRNRYPAQLSGGQQQRIGLARALAVNPKIMLMDEPFAALDAITRVGLQNELQKLHRDLNKTILLVTHDIHEAFKLGTKIMIINQGRIIQFDTPKQIIKHPKDNFVKSLIEAARAEEGFWRD